ncbi:hypothetical protein [Thermasporomyces composti]|jgi:hypothetical protein|uniref:ARB-07466-like C-terminal domain-containing protein n=1 Tax=Thermasporomyces composti TaxID=696763 RepID=A0A3D9V2H3_THECX|nr:hypothetical protein [Thermasporomyces composti]REF35576.1 hypothetical protein DFJ64_0957 [Thermasporomyces composti]
MIRKILGYLLIALIAGGLVVVGSVVASELILRQPLKEHCSASAGGATVRLTVEEAENAALISALSIRLGMPPRAATIALATAFQESGMRNIDYGHLDSLGLFQQRPSQGWGSPEQILDPYYSTTTFYTALAKVDGYTEMEIADAAQKVQISADGSAYAQHEPGARALASSLTGYSPGGFFCALRDDEPRAARPDGLRAELTKAFGDRAGPARVRRDADTRAAGLGRGDEATAVVEVDPPSSSTGWAVAQWAVAYAKRYGVTEVSYDGRVWSLEDSSEGWHDGENAPSNRVLIAFDERR